jgi:hypothetical protein
MTEPTTTFAPDPELDWDLLARDARLAEVVRRLVAAYQPERIYLFGSVARGEAGPDSDDDPLVVVPDAAPPERRGNELAYRALRGTGIAADVIVWPHTTFVRRARVVTSLPAHGGARGETALCRMIRDWLPRRGDGSPTPRWTSKPRPLSSPRCRRLWPTWSLTPNRRQRRP